MNNENTRSYSKCESGYPYHKSVCGVGCLGLMSDGTRPRTKINGKRTREYEVWKSMLNRCYSEKSLKRNPTYKDCYVCDRWLCFANFLEDLPLIEGYELWRDNPNQRISLDKDLKQQGIKNKVYSLETCCFISSSDNNKERNKRKPNLSIKVYGVNVKTGEKTRVFNSIHEVERELGVNHGNISSCINGRCKTACGYRWYKVEENLN